MALCIAAWQWGEGQGVGVEVGGVEVEGIEVKGAQGLGPLSQPNRLLKATRFEMNCSQSCQHSHFCSATIMLLLQANHVHRQASQGSGDGGWGSVLPPQCCPAARSLPGLLQGDPH